MDEDEGLPDSLDLLLSRPPLSTSHSPRPSPNIPKVFQWIQRRKIHELMTLNWTNYNAPQILGIFIAHAKAALLDDPSLRDSFLSFHTAQPHLSRLQIKEIYYVFDTWKSTETLTKLLYRIAKGQLTFLDFQSGLRDIVVESLKFNDLATSLYRQLASLYKSFAASPGNTSSVIQPQVPFISKGLRKTAVIAREWEGLRERINEAITQKELQDIFFRVSLGFMGDMICWGKAVQVYIDRVDRFMSTSRLTTSPSSLIELTPSLDVISFLKIENDDAAYQQLWTLVIKRGRVDVLAFLLNQGVFDLTYSSHSTDQPKEGVGLHYLAWAIKAMRSSTCPKYRRVPLMDLILREGRAFVMYDLALMDAVLILRDAQVVRTMLSHHVVSRVTVMEVLRKCIRMGITDVDMLDVLRFGKESAYSTICDSLSRLEPQNQT